MGTRIRITGDNFTKHQKLNGVATPAPPIGVEQESGKTLAQMHAEQLATKMFTDMMASAGVSVNRMAQELMYFIPRDFRDQYIALFMAALKGDDCDADKSGKIMKATGDLGKASGKRKNDPGSLDSGRGMGSGGGGKKYKKYWTIKDERALHLKDLIDKRLRAMGREIKEELAKWEESEG